VPPPVPIHNKVPTPAWALDIGAKLKEDSGGKYYEHSYTVSEKIYVYPHFKVVRDQSTPCWVHRPLGYKGKRKSRVDNAISATKKKKEMKIEAKVEEW